MNMANLVLYRKYRPKSFSEIIGQEHIIQTLTNAISLGIISHAYLFAGPRGSGKTSIARLLAKAVNCHQRQQFEPCNQCSSCVEIIEGRAMDLVEIDAASHRGIEEIKELKENIKIVPIKSRYKVFILDEVHQLSKDAFNALLKTLEEPPAHAIFVLATTEIHKMIPTIVSRCQRFDFHKLTIPEIIKRLQFICQNEKIKIEESALELIALNAGGSIRDAESLLDQVFTFSGSLNENQKIKSEDIKNLLGLIETNLVSQFTDFLIQKKIAEALNFLKEIAEKGIDIQEFTKTLIGYLRQGLILRITGASAEDANNSIILGLTKEEFQKLQKQAEILKEEEFKKIINVLLDAENKMRYSPILQLPLELAMLEILELKE